MKIKLEHEDKDDGIFFMDFLDYKQFFQMTACCALNHNELDTTTDVYTFPTNQKTKKVIQFRLDEDI